MNGNGHFVIFYRYNSEDGSMPKVSIKCSSDTPKSCTVQPSNCSQDLYLTCLQGNLQINL